MKGVVRHVSTVRNWIEPGTVRAGLVVWGVVLVLAVVIGLSTKLDERGNTKSSVTDNYRTAATAWVQSRTMYAEGAGADGWLYPPQGAVLFVPMLGLPRAVGEAVWRGAWVVLMGYAAWRLSRVVNRSVLTPSGEDEAGRWSWMGEGLWSKGVARWQSDERNGEAAAREGGGGAVDVFFVLSLLLVIACEGSIRNGQTNMPLGAAMVLAFVAAAERRWWGVVAWCVFGLMCKPVMIVAGLLLLGMWPMKLWWRMLAGAAVFAVLPFAMHTDWAFVLSECKAGISKIQQAAAFDGRAFADLRNVVNTLGIPVSLEQFAPVRLLAAVVTAGLCFWGVRRYGTLRGALVGLALCSAYAVLFNPRTEGNSYCIAAPAVAAWLAGAMVFQRSLWVRGLLLSICVTFAIGHVFSSVVMGRSGDVFFRPLAAGVFFVLVAWDVVFAGVFTAKGTTHPGGVGYAGAVKGGG